LRGRKRVLDITGRKGKNQDLRDEKGAQANLEGTVPRDFSPQLFLMKHVSLGL
jgi:hypothetical protein